MRVEEKWKIKKWRRAKCFILKFEIKCRTFSLVNRVTYRLRFSRTLDEQEPDMYTWWNTHKTHGYTLLAIERWGVAIFRAWYVESFYNKRNLDTTVRESLWQQSVSIVVFCRFGKFSSLLFLNSTVIYYSVN